MSSNIAGYVNPITNLEYPRAEVVGGTTSDPIVNLHFSWRPPEVLGGLTSTDIQHRVQLMTEGGVTVAADVIPDLFFERNFSGFDNITTRMSITVSVEPHDSSLAPSLPTVIPYAAVLECAYVCRTIPQHQISTAFTLCHGLSHTAKGQCML